MPWTLIHCRCLTCLVIALVVGLVGPAAAADPTPPAWPREFRAAWVATVNNIDWPSRPGLSTADQQREARAILDLARSTGLNAVIFQARTAADALYDSAIEPWSAYLSGKQGDAPDPAYDPLAFWVAEAHARGLLLHAWINPFRARIAGAKYAEVPSHVAPTRPDLVRPYGNALWLDPGEPEARALTLRVVADLARRYDVDGIHVDDYFYPYPIPDPNHPGQEVPFPDDASWSRAQATGVTSSRGDWRRSNVNALIEAMAATVRVERPQALFGISPFGIARPGSPAGVIGFDQYNKLAADAVLWFRQGWCDYLAPQLYWKVDAPGQPFRPLLDHWASVNDRGRHLWPGLSVSPRRRRTEGVRSRRDPPAGRHPPRQPGSHGVHPVQLPGVASQQAGSHRPASTWAVPDPGARPADPLARPGFPFPPPGRECNASRAWVPLRGHG